MAKIETRRIEALAKLDLDYYYWDKAAKSFGYIGITSLVLLFGVIFGNDCLKFILCYFKRLGNFFKKRKETKKEVKEKTKEEENVRIQMEYSEKLEEDLEQVYFKLVEINVRKREKN